MLSISTQIKSQHTGQYCCRLNNSAGTAESTADLVVKRKQLSPVFLKRLQSISENTGTRIVVEVEVGGTPSPSVYWFKDGVPIVNKPGHTKIHENGPCHTLIIANANVSIVFIYKLLGSIDFKDATDLATFHFYIIYRPMIQVVIV